MDLVKNSGSDGCGEPVYTGDILSSQSWPGRSLSELNQPPAASLLEKLWLDYGFGRLQPWVKRLHNLAASLLFSFHNGCSMAIIKFSSMIQVLEKKTQRPFSPQSKELELVLKM